MRSIHHHARVPIYFPFKQRMRVCFKKNKHSSFFSLLSIIHGTSQVRVPMSCEGPSETALAKNLSFVSLY